MSYLVLCFTNRKGADILPAFDGYFDGDVIRTLEKLNARKNQRVIITLYKCHSFISEIC